MAPINMKLLFLSRSVLAVIAEASGCWTLTGWVKTPHTNSSRWSWSTPSTRPSGATQTPNGSPRQCTSTGRCAASRQRARRAAAWARATSSTTPLEVLAAQPGEGTTPCSCTATARRHASCLCTFSQNKNNLFMVVNPASWFMCVVYSTFSLVPFCALSLSLKMQV